MRPEAFLMSNPSSLRLTRQKVFALTKRPLTEQYQATGSASSLRALVCQLPHIPRFVLAGEMTALVPLLKSCLTTSGLPVASTLACIKDVLQQDGTEDLIATLLPVWLDVATSRERSLEARVKALECVRAAAGKMKAKDLVMRKRDTLARLTKACDDKKRLVR